MSAVVTMPAVRGGDPIRRSDRRLGVVMLTPAVLYIALLVALPFLMALFLSLTNSSAGSLQFSYVGLRNFQSVLVRRVPSGGPPCGS